MKLFKLLKVFLLTTIIDLKNRKNRKNNESGKKIILVGHNCNKQGSQVLLEYIAKNMVERNYNILILVRDYGDLYKHYTSICKTKCFFGKRDFNRKIKKYYKRGFKDVIVNTVVNGDLVPILNGEGYTVECLIHELPQAIIDSNIKDRVEIIFKLAKRVVFPSSYVYKKNSRFGKCDNYIIAPQGLYLTKNHINNKSENLLWVKKEHNIESNNIIINVATGNKRKGFDIFLECAKRLKNNNIVFIWIGDYKQEIYDEKIGREKLSNLYLPGYINDSSKLAKYYDAAKILLLTSREEPFGSIVLEAFNAGTPCIGFKDAGGFVDTVIPGKTGELVKYDNVDELCLAIKKMIENKIMLELYSKNCKEFVKQFDFDKYIDRLVECFNE